MAAIQAGKHVFTEKPHGIDPAGLKLMRAACEVAKEKKLSVVSGLHSRHDPRYAETVQRIHDGDIGEIVSIEETREINLPHPNWIPGVARSGFGEVIHDKLAGEVLIYMI